MNPKLAGKAGSTVNAVLEIVNRLGEDDNAFKLAVLMNALGRQIGAMAAGEAALVRTVGGLPDRIMPIALETFQKRDPAN
jgi:hypothetical protein